MRKSAPKSGKIARQDASPFELARGSSVACGPGAEFEYYAQKIIVRKDLLKAPVCPPTQSAGQAKPPHCQIPKEADP